MSINSFVRGSLRLLASGAVLLMVGACATEKLAKEDQPQVTVRGRVAAEGGGAVNDCRLEFYDTAAAKPNYIWEISEIFVLQFQTARVTDDFYFRVRCKGQRVAPRSRVYDMDDLSHMDFSIDLGEMVVGSGMVKVNGRVATMDGSVPAACKLGLYTGFHREPSVVWDVAGDVAVEFEREKLDGHFQFMLTCEGYSQSWNSPKRPESYADDNGGRIDLGDMLVRK
jgi:hypothetical protein